VKHFLFITTLICLGSGKLNAQVCTVPAYFPNNLKLSFVRDLSPRDIPSNQVGVAPYVFNKYIPGTGEKFSMVGAYVNLYENRLKLNVNNISQYMFSSAPWALVSLNFKF